MPFLQCLFFKRKGFGGLYGMHKMKKGQANMISTAVALWKQTKHIVSTWRGFENRGVKPPKTTRINRLK